MALNSDQIGLLFRLQAENTASPEISKLKGEIDGLAGSAEGTAGGLNKLSSSLGLTASEAAALEKGIGVAGVAIGIATTAVVGLATVTVSTATALFSLTKSASDFGSEIFDASKKTSLHAETLTALKYAAETSGSSLDKVSTAVTKFTLLVGDAARGNEKATETLKRFGLTPQDAINDLDGSLGKVFSTIGGLSSHTEKLTAASDVFGKKLAGDLLPTIDSFDGDLNGLIETAKKLGLTLTDDQIKAADDFGDALDTVKKQAQLLGYQFALQLAPAITSALQNISGVLADNKENFRIWGTSAGNALTGTFDIAGKLVRFFSSDFGLNILEAVKYTLPGFVELEAVLTRIYGLIESHGAAMRQEQEQSAGGRINAGANVLSNSVPKVLPSSSDGSYLDNPSGAIGEAAKKLSEELTRVADERQKEREEYAKKDLAAQITILKNQLSAVEKEYDASLKTLREKFKENGNAAEFTEGYKNAAKHFLDEQLKVYPVLEAAQKKQAAEEKKTANELLLMANGQAAARKAATDKMRAETTENEKLITESAKKANAEREKDAKKTDAERQNNTIAAAKQHLAVQMATLEKDRANNEYLFAQKLITESAYYENKKGYALDAIAFQKAALEVELEAVRGNAEKTADVQSQLDAIEQKRQETLLKNGQESFEREKERQQKLLQFKREVLELERQTSDAENDKNRLRLEKEIEKSRGQAKIDALNALEQLDIENARTQKERRDADLKAERDAALERIKGFTDELDQKAQIEALYKNKSLLSEQEYQDALAAIKAQHTTDVKAEQDKDFSGGVLGGLAGALGENVVGHIASQAEYLKGVYNSLKNTAGAALGQMVQGLGQLLAAWVTTGKISGKAILQMTASILAGIAVQAGVKAVFELAEGYAALGNPFLAYTAPYHFAAAKLYGIVAGVALAAAVGVGALSRIGGDGASKSFGQETSGGYGTAGSSSGQGSSRNGGQNYSSFGNDAQTFETGRNAPGGTFGRLKQEITLRLQIDSNDSHIVDVVKDNVRSNGNLRDLIIEHANG